MRPTVEEQLEGIRRVIAEVVAPGITDPYAAAVLSSALDTLGLLAEASDEVPAFWRWDRDATAAVLAMIGIPVPEAPVDLLDLTALYEHQRDVRGLLERAMPTIVANPGARAACIQLFRDRAARFPMNARPTGGHGAHPAR
jgi:hypothetical protein